MGKKRSDPTEVLSGMLNIFGIKIDLKELLASSEQLKEHLEELRERLESAGGKGLLSRQAWSRGGVTITGHFRTRTLGGEQEFHVGTMGRPSTKTSERPVPEPSEAVEPPIDVFYEGEEVTIVADVPGVSLEELVLKVEGRLFSLSTEERARRIYRKELVLEAEVEPGSLQATCHNGVLEVRLQRRKAPS